jgi:Bacterial PH domain
MENYFKAAPLSRQIKLLSTLGVFVICGAMGVLYNLVPQTSATGITNTTFIADIFIMLALVVWATTSMIRGYEIQPGKIVIVRLLSRKEIQITPDSAARVDPEIFNGSFKKFGNGGFFSISGLFRNSTIGDFNAYITDIKKSVVINAVNGTFVISPENPSEFVESFSKLGPLKPAL